MATPSRQQHPTSESRNKLPTPPVDDNLNCGYPDLPPTPTPVSGGRPPGRKQSSQSPRLPAGSVTSRKEAASASNKKDVSSSFDHEVIRPAAKKSITDTAPAATSLPNPTTAKLRLNATKVQRSVSAPAVPPRSKGTPKTTPNKTPTRRKTPLAEKKAVASSQVDAQIRNQIREPTNFSKDKTKLGTNYIFRMVIDGRNFLKFGASKNPINRLQQIRQQCKIEADMLDGHDAYIIEYKLAEKLIHIELQNFRHQFTCICGKEHREIFEVSHKMALEVTGRWAAFCDRRPWDENGVLQKFWQHRLEMRLEAMESEKDTEVNKRARRWGHFANPTAWEKLVFDTASVLSVIQPKFWQWLSLLQAFYLFAHVPTKGTLTFLVSILVFMLFERDFASNISPRKLALSSQFGVMSGLPDDESEQSRGSISISNVKDGEPNNKNEKGGQEDDDEGSEQQYEAGAGVEWDEMQDHPKYQEDEGESSEEADDDYRPNTPCRPCRRKK
ncbi:hypothetical protein QQS21_000896 [Conoideocrella luteorostrata]|uniref:Bacteriophage T5 Orf172 DNA-binding domain-containing protein n=1 Tax=Conoideocrella luteorostrata TaxID=1105319 RepID=A0AAJ0CY78_9HYPO|nr:hypothetical protein QQS21_000896 [Conoideocrella luteorostrata]